MHLQWCILNWVAGRNQCCQRDWAMLNNNNYIDDDSIDWRLLNWSLRLAYRIGTINTHVTTIIIDFKLHMILCGYLQISKTPLLSVSEKMMKKLKINILIMKLIDGFIPTRYNDTTKYIIILVLLCDYRQNR